MSSVTRSGWASAFALLSLVSTAIAQDWPQWRGPNRDAKASNFDAPESWPAELTQKWKVAVGNGVATPAVVGKRIYVHARQGENEIIRCLNAENGEEIWQDQHPAEAPRGGASNYPGPRSSPAVADGKVVTLGVQGTLCCYDAATGKQLWRKDEFDNDVPVFNTSSSPIIMDGVCVAQLGGREQGGIVAFDLASGDEKWRWTEDTPAYGSPVTMTVDGTQVIVTPTDKNLVAVADGKTVWEMPFEPADRYNTFTPIVAGEVLITAGPGPGFSAFKMTKEGDKLVEERIWNNPETSIKFNTPVLKNGLIFGLSNGNQLFCINAKSGDTAWTAPISRAAEGSSVERGVENTRDKRVRAIYVQDTQEEGRNREGRGRGGFDRDRGRGEGRGGGRGRRGGGRRGGGGGYGSIVDADSVLLALSPAGELVVFRPSDEAYTELGRYKVAEGGTYAYPVAVGDAIYIKDTDSLTRWGVN